MYLWEILQSIVIESLLLSTYFLIITFGYPLLLLTCIPLWIYRELVKRFVQRDPKVGNILSGIDAVVAGNDPYYKPLAAPILYFLLTDKLDISRVVKILEENVIKPGHFPELTQKIVKIFGYQFYTTVDNFNVRDHVKYFNPSNPIEAISRTELRDLLNNTVSKYPFDPNLSPWEFLVVPNFVDDLHPKVKSAVVFRFNHCLMDGYSVFEFFDKCAVSPWKQSKECVAMINKRRSNKCKEAFNFLAILITGPYHVLRAYLFSIDWNVFVKNAFLHNGEDVWQAPQCTPQVPTSRIKNIKSVHGVQFSSVITTAVAHTCVSSMRRAGIPIPKRIHAFMTYPVPERPAGAQNHWSMVRMPIEVDERDPLKTLKFVDNEFQKLKRSPVPVMFTYGFNVIGLIPLWMRFVPEYFTPTTFFLSNFSGPTHSPDLFGCGFRQMWVSGRTIRGCAFAFTSVSLNEISYYDAGGAECNLPKQEDADYVADALMKFIKELEGNS